MDIKKLKDQQAKLIMKRTSKPIKDAIKKIDKRIIFLSKHGRTRVKVPRNNNAKKDIDKLVLYYKYKGFEVIHKYDLIFIGWGV